MYTNTNRTLMWYFGICSVEFHKFCVAVKEHVRYNWNSHQPTTYSIQIREESSSSTASLRVHPPTHTYTKACHEWFANKSSCESSKSLFPSKPLENCILCKPIIRYLECIFMHRINSVQNIVDYMQSIDDGCNKFAAQFASMIAQRRRWRWRRWWWQWQWRLW